MYHYTNCGLPNVYLENGYKKKTTPYGTGVAITDVEGLHKSLGLLLSQSPSLTGNEFRFLRLELDLPQAKLASIIEKSEQSVARYEKNKASQTGPHVRLLQVFYRESVTGNAEINGLIKTLQDMDKFEHRNQLVFKQDRGWHTNKAA